jgi:hypothetical protein
MSSNDFFTDLSIQFSKVSSEFDLDDGDHYRMERFADYTIGQIKENNVKELHRCFDFIESRLESVTPEIENALNVSYCEALLYYDDYKRGIEMKNVMPKKLLQFYLSYRRYYNSLG